MMFSQVWFWHRVHLLQRKPVLLEYMLIYLGAALTFLNRELAISFHLNLFSISFPLQCLWNISLSLWRWSRCCCWVTFGKEFSTLCSAHSGWSLPVNTCWSRSRERRIHWKSTGDTWLRLWSDVFHSSCSTFVSAASNWEIHSTRSGSAASEAKLL